MQMRNSPALTTLTDALIGNAAKVQTWFEQKAQSIPVPLTSSIDIRDSGTKIAPVDCNLYPGGFHHLCPRDLVHAGRFLKQEMDRRTSHQIPKTAPSTIGLWIEHHTTNGHYLDNAVVLQRLLTQAGLSVEAVWVQGADWPEGKDHQILHSASGDELIVSAISSNDPKPITSTGVNLDAIWMNNDLSGFPSDFTPAWKLPIHPSPLLGWNRRTKSDHFRHYNQLAREFSSLINIDPFLISIDTDHSFPVDFDALTGMDELRKKSMQMFERLSQAHAEHNIDEPPFLFLKNDSGTYGIGIMVIHSPDELDKMNRRTRNKMSTGKGGQEIHRICIQEGVPTRFTPHGVPSEPVIYLTGLELIGGFIRANPEKNSHDNLNSRGMVFEKLCMADLREASPGSTPREECGYGAIARLSALAAGLELQEIQNE